MTEKKQKISRIKKVLYSIHQGNFIKSGGSDSILASMFQLIIWQLGIKEVGWNTLMQRYLLDPSNNIPNNDRAHALERGNLQKELLNNRMSWKVFCKGLKFINLPKFEFIIRAHHINGSITEHSRMVTITETETETNEIEKEPDE